MSEATVALGCFLPDLLRPHRGSPLRLSAYLSESISGILRGSTPQTRMETVEIQDAGDAGMRGARLRWLRVQK